jgi:hypothetical protein
MRACFARRQSLEHFAMSSAETNEEACPQDACPQDEQPDTRFAHLGECDGVYAGNIIRSPLHLLGLLAGAAACGFFAWRMYADSGYAWSPEQGINAGVLFMSLGCIFCLVLLVLCFFGANCKLYLFEKGLVYRRGKKFTEVLWDQIAAVYEGISVSHTEGGTVTNTTHKVRFRLKNKQVVKLNLSFLDESDEASTIITGRTFPRLLAETKAGLARGEKVDFEKVKLHQEGISQGGILGGEDLLTWDQIGEAKIDNGYLTIKKGSIILPWNWTPVSDLPNFRVLFAYINHHVNGAELPELDLDSDESDSELLAAAH